MEPDLRNSKVEIWGGVECTVVRIKDSVHDQLEISGHEKRPDDLDHYADLGIRTIRYPLLWEKYAKGKDAFFRLHDERLNSLLKLNITPIAGLMHHGSGPFHTHLKDPSFADLLAEYAFILSERYPFIQHYTPINEPLTTARFSGLYGIWYPHLKDTSSFNAIFLNEMKGIILAMEAIRANNPDADLIQTEDLCKIYSTKKLQYQADFENLRRWLTYDILTGKLTPSHPLWRYFIDSGTSEKELDFFLIHKIDPVVCGFNYYLTSERYLDENIEIYPHKYHGGNGIHRYADIEAVRVSEVQANLCALLKEAWDRYHLPMALTEIHLACTREEQLRWFNEAYETGRKLRAENIDFRAVTPWSFFGSYDWNSLLRSKNHQYECGVFDIRSGKPRATAMAKMIKNITAGNLQNNKLLDTPGWWRRNIRNIYGETFTGNDDELPVQQPPILILGARGSLGMAFSKICHTRGLVNYQINHQEFEITSRESIESIIDRKKPWAIINTIGFSKIDEAEKERKACFDVNTIGPGMLADICEMSHVKLVTFSTDQVFNGKKRNPYMESDRTEPLNTYGESKRRAEEIILKENPRALIIRSSSFYNPWYESDPLFLLMSTGIYSNVPCFLPSDIIISPTYIADLVNTTLDLLIDDENGIWHLSNEEELSLFQFAKMAFHKASLNDNNLIGVPCEKLKYTAERPHYSVLSNSKGISLSPLSVALENYITELRLKTQPNIRNYA